MDRIDNIGIYRMIGTGYVNNAYWYLNMFYMCIASIRHYLGEKDDEHQLIHSTLTHAKRQYIAMEP